MFSISTASTIRVANLLGSRQPITACRSALLSLILSLVFVSFAAIVIWTYSRTLSSYFTSESYIKDRVESLAPLAAGLQILNGLHGSIQGIFRGMGRHSDLAAYVSCFYYFSYILVIYLFFTKSRLNVLSFWFMGIPTGWYLAYEARPTYGLEGSRNNSA